MLELATLGLLQGEPLNGYRLKQQLELFMSGCISANYGAIYPLMRRLEQKGLICVIIDPESKHGASGKIYRITATGKARWHQKMMEQPQESWVHARSRFMIKFFFFSYLESAERLKLLENRLIKCQSRLADKDMEELPDDPYQAAAWQRFKLVIETEISWLSEQILLEQKKLV
ncbi:PadR family transcriptional regulator [Crocosphaera sp. XPORK-15E]|uniref:PadR family transcriptional regulator n=1 Tax=Crocosphaera sp. XPORK-15E TaxID=3110247 RepID=UPI002B1F7386|nr:PadR family transcriptional regulator [Crocosphaera sp. XPORK-15E]MEA5533610.1 PadR family transcriptional regulator [Crocosphaera sp. XPORK-15E]